MSKKVPHDPDRRFQMLVDLVSREYVHCNPSATNTENIDWVLVIALDINVFLRNFTQLMAVALVVMLGTLVVCLFVALQLVNTMLANETAKNARRFHGGDSDQEVRRQ